MTHNLFYPLGWFYHFLSRTFFSASEIARWPQTLRREINFTNETRKNGFFSERIVSKDKGSPDPFIRNKTKALIGLNLKFWILIGLKTGFVGFGLVKLVSGDSCSIVPWCYCVFSCHCLSVLGLTAQYLCVEGRCADLLFAAVLPSLCRIWGQAVLPFCV